ncbi:hypothetical protein [Herbiconiux sp. UC225_62]|uniref:hypothetical protein n=1 Tax=Herbiconiux sp. UC225_62 TaxID=3350168 RepID=UPI0036D26065
MSDRRDDDAFAWAGDDDPTLAPVGSPVADDELDDDVEAAASESPAVAAPASPAPSTAPATSTSPSAPAGSPAGPSAHAAPARRTVLDEAEEAEDRAVDKELAEAEAASKQLSSPALIGMGILGGVYLLYTIGWIVSFSRYQTPLTVDFSVVSYRITQTLAIAATPLWFVATLLLTQTKDIRFRFLWLVIGVLVLVPWPFLMGV